MTDLTPELQRVARTYLPNQVVADLLGDEDEFTFARNGQQGHYAADRSFQVGVTSTRIEDRQTGQTWTIPHSAFRAYRRDTSPALIAKLDALPDKYRKNQLGHPTFHPSDSAREKAIKRAVFENVRRVNAQLRAEEAELLDQIMPAETLQETLL